MSTAKRASDIPGPDAYEAAKKAAWKLVGWYARDPRLRNSGAWDCYSRYILGKLKI